MTFRFPKLAKILSDGLRYAARTAAVHEAMPWEGAERSSSLGLIRGIEAGASGGVPGKRPRHR